MRRGGILWGIILWYVLAQGSVTAQMLPDLSVGREGAILLASYPKKPHTLKSKKHKPRKHKSKKHHKKRHQYSVQHIEKVLENKKADGVCNRLQCASNLQIAKSCLNTKASHREHKECFEAFCAYGCNEEDYRKNPDLYDFCNLTCASKRRLIR